MAYAGLAIPPKGKGMRRARLRLEQAVKAKDRDLVDAIYLACAVDGDAFLLVSKDSDLRSLGDE